MAKNKAILTTDPVGRTLLYLALPMVMGILSKTIYNLTDTYFVARLGTQELAAMSFTFPVVMVLGGLTNGLGIGTASVVSRAIGRGDEYSVRRLVSDALLLAFCFAVVLTIIGYSTITPLFTMLGATPEILPLVKAYMVIWYFGVVFVVLPMVSNNCIRATGNTVFPSLIMISSAVVNVFLDPLLIFGLMGFPRMELTGAAVATVISRFLTLVAAFWFLYYKAKLIEFKIRSIREIFDSWRQIAFIGVPVSTSRLLIPLSMGLVTWLAAGLGPKAVASLGSGIRISALTLVPLRALSQSMVPYVGQNWGAKLYDRVQRGRVLSWQFCLLWGTSLVLVLWLFAGSIARAFSTDPEVVKGIILFLWIDPLGYGLRGVFITSNSLMNAINRPMIPVILMITRLAILYVPLAYIGMKIQGLVGMFAGMAVANIIAGLLAGYFAKRVSEDEEKRVKTR